MHGSSGPGKALHPSARAPYLLLGLLALLTLAIGGIAWKFHLQQKLAFENEVKARLLAIADSKVRQIHEWRQVRLGQAHELMDDPIANQAFARVVNGRASVEERRRMESFLASVCRNLHYAGALLADREGRVTVSAGRRFGDDPHFRMLMQMVLRTGNIVERDLHHTEPVAGAHLGLGLPLRASSGGAIFGGLLLSIDPTDYLYPLQAWPVPTRSGEILLVRREGDNVLYLTDRRGQPGSALNTRVPLTRREMAAVMAVNGIQGNVEALDYRGMPVFAALRPVPDTAWYLVAKMDSEEVWEPMRRGSTMLGVNVLSLALAAGALIFILWRRQQVRVYRELYEASVAHRALAEQYDYLSRFANDVIILLDAEGNIVRANGRAADIYGYPVETLAGMNVRDLRTPEGKIGFALDWRLSAERASMVYATVHQSRDGREFPVEVSLQAVEVEGRVYRQAILRDISERKLAEIELSRSEARFRQLVENSPYGIVVVEGLEIRYANPAAMQLFGATLESELVGRPLTQLVNVAEREDLIRNAQLFRSGQRVPLLERRYHRMDGSEFWASISATPIEYNGCPATLLFYQDVSAHRQAAEQRSLLEEQLRQAQKMESVGRLAGGVAHDFNNYFTVINGYCDMLLADVPPEGELHEGLQEIRDAGERAALLTRQLLTFSSKQLAAPCPVCLNQSVIDSSKMLRRLMGEQVEIVTCLKEGLRNVMADPGQMDQILMNLTINARDAMPAGGRIEIETREAELDLEDAGRNPLALPGSYVVLSVADTGIGIAPEVREKIFEPFFTTKGVGHGTGLGLCTAYGSVHQAGGWISVESAPGCGATFSIWLPVTMVVPAKRIAPGACAKAEKAPKAAATLLVVEDRADVRRMVLSILKHDAYRLLEAEDADQALRISEGHAGAIDLLVTDVMMPGMTGRELADRLVGQRPGLKVLYISGYSGDAMGGQAFLEPGMEYLAKPFSPDQLSGKVSELLSAPSVSGRTILVIEDDAAVSAMLRQILRGAGYQVLLAADGRLGMNVLERETVDLVITDLVMPEQEGLETLTLIRAQRPFLPVIAISGAFGGAFLKTAEMLGAAATLPKPIAPEALLRAVEQVLQAAPRPLESCN